jgi:pimeloyl-ACP methyl ester carboxylesterase
MVRESFALCCVDPTRVPPEVIDAHVAAARDRMRMPWADVSMLAGARSMLRLLLRRRRFIRMLERVGPPTLLINGEGDRLVKLAAAKAVSASRGDWTFRSLDELGHTPQLEDPARVADEIWSWLEGPGAPAWATASPSTTLSADA